MTAVPTPGIGLGLSIRSAEGAVVAVAGELDVATAPDFAAVLDALIDRGHLRITVDCSELSFIDASGVGVLAAAHGRLLPTRGEISLLGVTGLAYRILEITELLDPLHVEAPHRDSPREFSDGGDLDPIAGQATRLAAASAHADALAGMLSRMTALIPGIMTPCDGASVTLRRRDHMITAAASDDTARDLDYVQYRGDQGPCVEAASSGIQTHAPALGDEQRWQSFTSEARERGIESVLSSPLIVNDQPTGALNLYSRTPHAFQAIHQDLASILAEQTAMLLHEPDDPTTTTHEFDERIHDALTSREIIAQGQGVLMERLGVNAHDAYLTLRRDSVEISTSLRRQAAYVIAETQKRPRPPHPDGPADE